VVSCISFWCWVIHLICFFQNGTYLVRFWIILECRFCWYSNLVKVTFGLFMFVFYLHTFEFDIILWTSVYTMDIFGWLFQHCCGLNLNTHPFLYVVDILKLVEILSLSFIIMLRVCCAPRFHSIFIWPHRASKYRSIWCPVIIINEIFINSNQALGVK